MCFDLHAINEKIPQNTSNIYDQDKKLYSGRGIHFPCVPKVSRPRPVSLSSGRYTSVKAPNTLTAIMENKQVRAARVAVAVRALTDAL